MAKDFERCFCEKGVAVWRISFIIRRICNAHRFLINTYANDATGYGWTWEFLEDPATDLASDLSLPELNGEKRLAGVILHI